MIYFHGTVETGLYALLVFRSNFILQEVLMLGGYNA